MSKPGKVVIVLSDLETRRRLAAILDRLGLDPICVSSVTQCRELLDQGDVGLVFCGRHFADGDSETILTAASGTKEPPAVVLMSAHPPGEPSEAIPLGAFDVLSLPGCPTDVEWMVIRAGRLRGDPGRAFGSETGSRAGSFAPPTW
jgi:DNA-binding NtrC family response regulator